MKIELTGDQIQKANRWYSAHKEHVDRLTSNNSESFPPSITEDLNSPGLWKPGHWNWFFQTYKASTIRT